MMGQVGTLCRLDLDKSVPGQVERLITLRLYSVATVQVALSELPLNKGVL